MRTEIFGFKDVGSCHYWAMNHKTYRVIGLYCHRGKDRDGYRCSVIELGFLTLTLIDYRV